MQARASNPYPSFPQYICQFFHRLGWAFGMLDESVTNASDNAGRKPAAAMWDCKENNTIDSGLMPEKEVFHH